MNNPWKKLNKKKVYENPWISVDHYEVLNAAGNPGIYGTVHFKNLAVGIIPIDQFGNTWIVGQYRFPLDSYSWEIPEGGNPVGRNPLEGAKRELLEETGIKAKKWTEILQINTSNSVTDELGIIYLAQDLEFFTPNPDEDEIMQVKKIPFEELFKMAMEGEIKDSLSLAAILKLQHLLEKKEVEF